MVDHFRPLNSRESFPLWLRFDSEDVSVFNELGMLSSELEEILDNLIED